MCSCRVPPRPQMGPARGAVAGSQIPFGIVDVPSGLWLLLTEKEPIPSDAVGLLQRRRRSTDARGLIKLASVNFARYIVWALLNQLPEGDSRELQEAVMSQMFFLYARKSTESEKRQVLSIESQIVELRSLAQKENIIIKAEFTESMTAKEPGRPLFNEMISRIEKGEAQGIIAWHPDRLARNSVDGGRIVYLLDTGHIKFLKFPTFWFESSPQGKFMLNIAFGQSKYYIDNLSENVKRGLRQKVRNGVWPGLAPPGYLNNKNLRKVVIDPVKGPLVRRMFEAYATGEFNLPNMQKQAFEWGLMSRSGKFLSKSELQRILKF